MRSLDLFGSSARGDSGEDSDMDLLMLEADPEVGETLFEIGDGQGRAFYSFQRAVRMRSETSGGV